MQERARVVADKIGGTSAPLRVGRLPCSRPNFFEENLIAVGCSICFRAKSSPSLPAKNQPFQSILSSVKSFVVPSVTLSDTG